jgi:HemY protein
MRAVIWLVLLFVVAVVAATTLGGNDGLVTFYWGGWRLDLSLNLFIVGLLVTCFVLVSAINGVNALIGLPERAREWRSARRERAAQAALREALAEFFGARYSRAQKAAQRALAIQDAPTEFADAPDLRVLSHLLAAASLHRLQERAQRNRHLQSAQRLAQRPGASRAADEGAQMLAAEWALDDRDAPRALQLLAELPPGAARRIQALRLKLQAQRLDDQPLEALRTARLLAKHQGLSPLAAQSLLRSLACEALDSTRDAQQLRRVWQQFDAADRRDPFVVARAVRCAARVGLADEARGWLRPLWERPRELEPEGREQIAQALLDVVDGLGPDWLPCLEAALNAYTHEPAVVLAVGTAFAERQLWGKARQPLEQGAGAVHVDGIARRRAWRLLAQLARNEGDEARAALCEREAAAID